MTKREFCPVCRSQLVLSGENLYCELSGTEYCNFDSTTDTPLSEKSFLKDEAETLRKEIKVKNEKLNEIESRLAEL